MTTFFLGTHMPHWLGQLDIPLFVSHRRLAGRKRLPVARAGWALDSGGFSELSLYGAWRTTSAEYVTAVRRYVEEIGHLDWAAPQDWMTEAHITARTGLSVRQHLALTVDNYVDLRSRAPDLPFVPVLQGRDLADYEHCIDLYGRAGVDLVRERVVGVGSVCRRQSTSAIHHIVTALSAHGLSLHGFGVKTAGLARYAPYLVSADSMAWSYSGRRTSGCSAGHRNEANCQRYALHWRSRVLDVLSGPQQYDLFGGVPHEPRPRLPRPVRPRGAQPPVRVQAVLVPAADREWTDGADLRLMYRRARANAHPDRRGGDRTAWDQVEAAGRVLGLDGAA